MKTLLLISFCLLSVAVFSQNGNNFVQNGNDAYRKNDYKTAVEQYQKALHKEPGNIAAKFNMANALLRQKDAAGATKQYDDILTTTNDQSLKAKTFYNKGLASIQQQKLDDAIAQFKQALNLAPEDNDIRENLQKALNEKRKKDEQNQQKNKQQPKKDQPKPQQKEKPANKQLMEQKFNELRNQEKQLQKQLQRKPVDNQPEKDW